MIIKDGGSGFELIKEDTYQAVCYGLFDLGSHENKISGKIERKCAIMWEIPDVRIAGIKNGSAYDFPRTKSKTYTASLNAKSNLNKDLTSWRGKAFTEDEMKGFELKKILGVNCMIQIIHKAGTDRKVRDIIGAILPLYKGIPSKSSENKVIYFALSESAKIPGSAPNWIKQEIASCEEFKSSVDAIFPFSIKEEIASCEEFKSDEHNETDVPF